MGGGGGSTRMGCEDRRRRRGKVGRARGKEGKTFEQMTQERGSTCLAALQLLTIVSAQHQRHPGM